MLPPNPRIPKLTNSTTRTSLVSKPAGVTYTKLAVIAAAVPLVKAAELLSIDNGLDVAGESSICKKKFEKYNRFAVDIMSKTKKFFHVAARFLVHDLLVRLKLFGRRKHSTTSLSVLFPNVGAVPKNSLAFPEKFTFICHIKRVFFLVKKERLTKPKGPKESLRRRLNKVFGFGCLSHAVGR